MKSLGSCGPGQCAHTRSRTHTDSADRGPCDWPCAGDVCLLLLEAGTAVPHPPGEDRRASLVRLALVHRTRLPPREIYKRIPKFIRF